MVSQKERKRDVYSMKKRNIAYVHLLVHIIDCYDFAKFCQEIVQIVEEQDRFGCQDDLRHHGLL